MNKEQILNTFMVALVAVVVVGSGLMVELNLHSKEVREKSEALVKTSTHFEDFVPLPPLDAASMKKEGFILYKGKMYKTKGDVVSPMLVNVLLPNSTKVMVSGRTLYGDGTSKVLKENEMINMNGDVIPANRDLSKVTIQQPLVFKGKKISGKIASYQDFSQEDYETAMKANKVVLLYFYADWDLVCKTEEPQIEDAFNKLVSDDIVGFRVNYNDSNTSDAEKKLATELSATYQHTKVVIKGGTPVLKSEDAWISSQLITTVSQYL